MSPTFGIAQLFASSSTNLIAQKKKKSPSGLFTGDTYARIIMRVKPRRDLYPDYLARIATSQ
jgi:hypothetical protein